MPLMINFHATLNYFLKTQQRTMFYEKLLHYYQYNLDNDRYIENFHNDGYGLIVGNLPVEVQDKFGALETISLAGMLKQSTKTIFEEAGIYSRNTHSLVLKTLSECGLIRVWKPTAPKYKQTNIIEIVDDLEILSDLKTESEYLKTQHGREILAYLEYAKYLDLVKITEFRLMFADPQKLYDEFRANGKKFTNDVNPFDLKAQIKKFNYKKTPESKRDMMF